MCIYLYIYVIHPIYHIYIYLPTFHFRNNTHNTTPEPSKVSAHPVWVALRSRWTHPVVVVLLVLRRSPWVGGQGVSLGNVREMSGNTKQRQWKHITYVLYLIYRKMGTGKVAMIVYRGISFLNNYQPFEKWHLPDLLLSELILILVVGVSMPRQHQICCFQQVVGHNLNLKLTLFFFENAASFRKKKYGKSPNWEVLPLIY